MRKKILVISLFAVFMLVILPISAVVGTHNVKTNLHNNKIYSPLFANRIDNVLSKKSKTMNIEYIGKSTFFNFFTKPKTSFHSWIDKAVRLVNKNPNMLFTVLNKLFNIPGFVDLIREYGISKESVEKEIACITNDKEKMKEKVDRIIELYSDKQIEIPKVEPPKPLGFSGQIGCILTFFLVVFPIIMLIGGFVSAIVAIIVPGTFIVPGCLEWVFEKVFESISEGFQGLTPT